MKRKNKKKLWLLNGLLMLLTVAGVLVLLNVWNDNQSNQNAANTNTKNQGLSQSHNNSNNELIVPTITPEPTATPEPTPTPPAFTDAVWIGVGDIMSHTPQLPGAYDKDTDSYNFDSVFSPIAHLVEEGDWRMANLETPMAGKDYGYTGYPTFNAPIELAQALWNNGFNVLSTANNHTLDKGVNGAIRTLDNVKELGFTTVGSARDVEESEQSIIIEQNQIAMGFLSYTYGTNGIPIPEGKEFIVNLIDKQAMIEDIQKLRRDGAEVITIALHFGNEYQTKPTDDQKTLARELIAAGADIIAGSHPHVLQPYEVVTTLSSDGQERNGVIIYSMGNFISNQRGESKDYGGIFRVDVRKHFDTGIVEIMDVKVTPTWVHRYKPDNYYRYRILPVEETLDAKNDTLLKQSDYDRLEADYAMLNKRLSSMLEEAQ